MDRQNLILLSGLGALLAAIVCGVSSYLLSQYPLVWMISGGVATALSLLFCYLNLEKARETLSKRTTRYSLNSIAISFLGLAIVVVVNLIIVEHDWKKDLTKNKLHSLSDESQKVLKGLKSEVLVQAFVTPDHIHTFTSIFEKYQYHSKLFKTEFVDVHKEPLKVREHSIKSAPTLIIESENRKAVIENLRDASDPKTEEKITNAIIQVAKGEKKKVYFISGHGEKLPTDSGRGGYSEIRETLEGARYKVSPLTLVDKQRMPEDAEIVVCAGPKNEFIKHELELMDSYVKRGGKLLMLLEPHSPPMLKDFLAKFGVDWKPKKTVFESNPLLQIAGGSPIAPVVQSYDGSHEITRGTNQPSIYPIPTPVDKMATVPSDYKVTSLFSTSTNSFEFEPKGSQMKVSDIKPERKGPISLAVAVSGKAEEAKEKANKPDDKNKDATAASDVKKPAEFRMVVVGDSDFVSNGVRGSMINSDVFQNVLSWLAEEEDLISIRAKEAEGGEFEITEERFRVINLASVVFAPFGMFFAALAVWLKRRRM